MLRDLFIKANEQMKLILKKGKIKRKITFQLSWNPENSTNAKYFCVNISTPPFHLKLWDKKF